MKLRTAPKNLLRLTLRSKLCGWIPDPLFLKLNYRIETGLRLNLKQPTLFNEKLQWLKLHQRSPRFTALVDKYAVRAYVEEKLGAEYLIPLLGVWQRPEEVDFDALPQQFVLKCNHNSGLGMCICRDKSSLDIAKTRQELRRGMRQNYYLTCREWPYRDVPRRIIAEQYMTDESGTELKDYKIFCFDGEPQLIEVDFDRFISHRRNLYTTDWEFINSRMEYPNDPQRVIPRPAVLPELLRCARVLSQGFPFSRIDLYVIDGRVYFGEITFYHGGGYDTFSDQELNRHLGSLIRLP